LAFFRALLDESLQVSLVLDFSAHNLAFFKALRFVWSYFRDEFIRPPLLAPNCRDMLPSSRITAWNVRHPAA
jgi:hypothetical protein